MITEATIENYKSISKLTLPLGRVTVLIGENGSGKSNILEAIALGSAAASDKLDNEFLAPRGIRVTPDPRFMRSAFEKESVDKDIVLTFGVERSEELNMTFGNQFKLSDDKKPLVRLSNNNKPYSQWSWSYSTRGSFDPPSDIRILLEEWKTSGVMPEELRDYIPKWDKPMSRPHLENFLIGSPEYSCLRNPSAEGQIQPLGIHGEGLIRYAHYLSTFEDGQRLNDVKERMQFLEWFQDFKTSSGFMNSISLEIRDQFLSEDLGAFDQLSANEGFLFILFYFCLLVGAETPRFFAIDNVDTSLNPKLCTRLVKEMVYLAKKYDKQVILTTHNPAILDGLNLDDDEQRLFVVERDIDGHTAVRRVQKPKVEEGEKPVRLSEAFLRGYIGGLPRNF